MAESTERGPLTTDEHAMDMPLGNIHQVSIQLAMLGQHSLGLILGQAHEQIQQHILTQDERLKTAEEALAEFMIAHSFATGHGDSHESLLGDLDWQLTDKEQRSQQLETVAKSLRDALKEAIVHPVEGDGARWNGHNRKIHAAITSAQALLGNEAASVTATTNVMLDNSLQVTNISDIVTCFPSTTIKSSEESEERG